MEWGADPGWRLEWSTFLGLTPEPLGGEGGSCLWVPLPWEYEPGDKSPLVLEGIGFGSPGGLVVGGKAQAPSKGTDALGSWTISSGCALITWVTGPLEGLPDMDPLGVDTSGLTTPVSGLATITLCRDCEGVS